MYLRNYFIGCQRSVRPRKTEQGDWRFQFSTVICVTNAQLSRTTNVTCRIRLTFEPSHCTSTAVCKLLFIANNEHPCAQLFSLLQTLACFTYDAQVCLNVFIWRAVSPVNRICYYMEAHSVNKCVIDSNIDSHDRKMMTVQTYTNLRNFWHSYKDSSYTLSDHH